MTADALGRDRCLESGMDNFVAKPIRMDDVAAALRGAQLGLGSGVSTDPGVESEGSRGDIWPALPGRAKLIAGLLAPKGQQLTTPADD